MMERMDDSAPSEPATRPPVTLASGRIVAGTCALAVLAALVTWLWGYLPWVLDGFRLDPGAASRSGFVGSQGLDRLPIPMLAVELVPLVAFTLVGAVTATLLPLVAPTIPKPAAVGVTSLVVVVTVLVLASIARSSLSGAAAGAYASDPRVLDGLFAAVIGIAVLGALLGAAACLQRGFAPIAVAVLLAGLASWLPAAGVTRAWVLDVATVVLLGGAFVLSVRRSTGWVALWPVALLIVWVTTPATIALQVVEDMLGPGKSNDDHLDEVFSAARQVFGNAFRDVPRTWWPEAVALVIGLLWLAVRSRRARTAR